VRGTSSERESRTGWPAFGGRQRGPLRERARGGGDGEIDIGGGGRGDLRDQRAVVRIEHVDRAAFDGVREAAVDEQLGLHE
jgi:hypothetical protein